MMIGLKLDLLGPFRLRAEEELTLSSRKAQALIAYLAVPAGQAHSRDKLAGLLWGERSDQAARHSLRQTLSSIRKAMESAEIDPLTATADAIALSPSAAEVDVDRLERLAAEGTLDALTEAVALYRGDLLEGIRVSEPQFEEWLTFERGRLRELARHACLKLFDLQAQAAEFELATKTGRRLLTFDPLHEEIHRALMRLYAASGQRGLALRQYETCRRVLAEELDLEPDEDTERLLRDIRRLRPEELARLIATLEPSETATESRPERSSATTTVAPEGAATQSDLQLPDKPSIVVLPFQNMSGDPEREYFSDGFTADIINGLSQLPALFVIAPSTSFTFKGQLVSVRNVATQLGVRYVLDGSVHKDGNRLGVTAQLNDGSTGEQIWTKRFDGQVKDMFAIQAELAKDVAGVIVPDMDMAELQRARSEKPDNFDAWDWCQRGLWHLYRRTKKDLAEALKLFEHAIEIDPNFVRALAGSVDALYHQIVLGFTVSDAECRDEAMAKARGAVELDPANAAARCALGAAHIIRREHDAAIPELETAIELNPSLAWAHYGLGAAHVFSGRARQAVPHLEKAMRLSPRDQHMGSFLARMADVRLLLRQYDEAVNLARKALRQPIFEWSRHATLLSALGHLGRLDEAQSVLDELLRHKQDFTLEFVRQAHLFTGLVMLEFVNETQLFTDQDEFAHYLDGIRKAGVASGLDTP